ncbi:MAG: hypothetical protein ACOCUN_00200 [Jiangellaceae bacterium]
MYEILNGIADGQAGVVMRSQALDAGLSADDMDALLKRKEWVPLRRAAYVHSDRLAAMSDEDRHRAAVHAVVHTLRRPAVVSHTSAVVMHGLPTWGLDLSEVHVSRTDLHSSRFEAGVRHHQGEIREDDTVTVAGVRVMGIPRTVIDTARISSFEAGVCVADAAFRLEPAAHAATLARLNEMRDWQGARNAGAVVSFADGRSESVGESRLRVLFRNVGLPQPELQVEFHSESGLFVARSDFYFREQRTVGEFDGKEKYQKYLAPGEQPGDVVWREKRREDSLRRLGNEVERAIWADLDRPRAVEARFRQAFARAERRGR